MEGVKAPFIFLMIESNYQLIKYVRIAVNSFRPVRITTRYFNFRCNICGDSKKNKFKKRGYIIYSKKLDKWFFKCHNCNTSMPADYWLKKYFPHYYRDYIKEIIQSKKADAQKKEDKAVSINTLVNDQKEKTEEKNELKKEAKHFISITKKSNLQKTAVKFCVDRKIPDKIWSNWYVCTEGTYRGRLIIPFYDNENRIYFFQARTLIGSTLKYINQKGSKDKAIYNIYNVDKTKPVIVLEGPIDSLFVENSIATLGLGISEEMQNQLDKLDCYYIFDFDKSGLEKSKKFLLQGKQIFLWKKYLTDLHITENNIKDINELYCLLNGKELFAFDKLKKYFSNNIFDTIYL